MATTCQQLVQNVYGKGTAADQNESDPLCNATTPTLIARNSPARYGLLVTNVTAQVLAVSYNPAMTFTSAMQVPPGGTLESNWLTDLESPSRAMWALLASGTGTVHVTEQFLIESLPAEPA